MHYRDALPAITRAVADILTQHPSGLSEYELLTELRRNNAIPAEGQAYETDDTTPSPQLALFQSHFLLFHVLYRLRDDYWQNQRGQLEITPLQIQLLPYRQGKLDIAAADPLKDYYLDLNNLDTTGDDDVSELLTRFWMHMNGGEQRRQALDTLGLDDKADLSTIKKRYRELAMQHHPDRGGDKEKLQALNAAMAWLAKYSRR